MSTERVSQHAVVRGIVARIINEASEKDHKYPLLSTPKNKKLSRWEYSVGNVGDKIVIKFNRAEFREAINYAAAFGVEPELDCCHHGDVEYHIAEIIDFLQDGRVRAKLTHRSYSLEDLDGMCLNVTPVAGLGFIEQLIAENPTAQKLADLDLVKRLYD